MDHDTLGRLLVRVGDPVVHQILTMLHERVMTLEAALLEEHEVDDEDDNDA